MAGAFFSVYVSVRLSLAGVSYASIDICA
jgi:hypothetical protein